MKLCVSTYFARLLLLNQITNILEMMSLFYNFGLNKMLVKNFRPIFFFIFA
jgi:hypothetical protein